MYYSLRNGLCLLRREGPRAFLKRLKEKLSPRLKIFLLRRRHRRLLGSRYFQVDPVPQPSPPRPTSQTVDIIICVHNALEDVQRCLESLIRYTLPPYNLILVDDGSDRPTQAYLADFAAAQGALLLRNDQARGYTRAANQGLRASSAEYLVLLNSDTLLTPLWLERLIECAESDSRLGLVGPLSNTASWQSVPEIFAEPSPQAPADPPAWAENPLPPGLTVAEMAARIARASARLYPRLPFLNGFCLLLKRRLIEQIGLFDEQTFGEGYGEENDLCLRAAGAGWQFAVADDAYIFHAQSRSYSHQRRIQLARRADQALIHKHGSQRLSQGILRCRADRLMRGIRARIGVIHARQTLIEQAKQRWEGKRLAFILPIAEPSGGGHVIFQEAEAMQRMGVIVEILNLAGHKSFFERAYPDLEIPLVYVERPEQALPLLPRYDAVIATLYHTLSWFQQLPQPSARPNSPRRAYYIQDFEPDFFTPGSPQYQQALASYTPSPDLVYLTKTEWNRQTLLERSGLQAQVVGPSVHLDLFRPRPRQGGEWPDRPLRVAAMIRPSTPRRQPALTMQVLREIARRHRSSVEVLLFGCDPADPDFHKLPTDFPWRHAGLLNRTQLANLLNQADIFVDFSSFQAMGLTAMEAMACGAAVIVPKQGGASSFARHEQNALIVDTTQPEACIAALDRLLRDEALRQALQEQATLEICRHFPENPAYRILEALFGA